MTLKNELEKKSRKEMVGLKLCYCYRQYSAIIKKNWNIAWAASFNSSFWTSFLGFFHKVSCMWHLNLCNIVHDLYLTCKQKWIWNISHSCIRACSHIIQGTSVCLYAQRNHFEILLNQTEIRVYLAFSDLFGTKRTFVWFKPSSLKELCKI